MLLEPQNTTCVLSWHNNNHRVAENIVDGSSREQLAVCPLRSPEIFWLVFGTLGNRAGIELFHSGLALHFSMYSHNLTVGLSVSVITAADHFLAGLWGLTAQLPLRLLKCRSLTKIPLKCSARSFISYPVPIWLVFGEEKAGDFFGASTSSYTFTIYSLSSNK